MDLIGENSEKNRFSWSKASVFVCFTLSAALLLNSLLHPNTLTSGSKKPVTMPNSATADIHDR